MSDQMMLAVLQMPYDMAMSDELSRRQFYNRVQELVARFEALPVRDMASSGNAEESPSSPADGWLQNGGLLYRLTDESTPQNRDEINVTMADGSRSHEARARRAGELLDRIRATHHTQNPIRMNLPVSVSSEAIEEGKRLFNPLARLEQFKPCAFCGSTEHKATCDSGGAIISRTTGCPVHDSFKG